METWADPFIEVLLGMQDGRADTTRQGRKNQSLRTFRIAAPRFPAVMREPLVWGRGVRSYEDLVRFFANRGVSSSGRARPYGMPGGGSSSRGGKRTPRCS